MPPRSLTLLGSTGSIGSQAEQVIATHPGRFDVYGLAAGGNDLARLAAQIAALGPQVVALARPGAGEQLREALDRHRRQADDDGPPVGSGGRGLRVGGGGRDWRVGDLEILDGADAVAELAGRGVDVVLNGITGSVGLAATLAALAAGSTLALANKESLVAGGALVMNSLRREDQIIPVDSEHSAIAQCLRSGYPGEVARLILTASGGPFRGRRRADLGGVGPDQALAHPTWRMGPVVTINSATLINKALEVIEAHWLFGIPADQIDVVVHPQSVIHSMVQFHDGAIIAQASPPDMRLPIALGLSWPERLTAVSPPVDFTAAASWTFEPLDAATFPAVDLARRALATSPTHPAVLNAANEVCVEAFLAGQIGFLDIVETVGRVVEAYAPRSLSDHGVRLVDVLDADAWGRRHAVDLLATRPSDPAPKGAL